MKYQLMAHPYSLLGEPEKKRNCGMNSEIFVSSHLFGFT